MITTALVQHLAADTAVSGAVTRGPLTAIYPSVIPQKTPHGVAAVPAITYRLRQTQRTRTYTETIGLVNSRIEINAFDKTATGALSLAAAVRAALVDYSGDMDGTTVRDIAIQDEGLFEDLEPGLYRVVQVFSIWHEE